MFRFCVCIAILHPPCGGFRTQPVVRPCVLKPRLLSEACRPRHHGQGLAVHVLDTVIEATSFPYKLHARFGMETANWWHLSGGD